MPSRDQSASSPPDEPAWLEDPPMAEVELTAIYAALADPTRLQIVRTLADGQEHGCSELATNVSKATAAHHFKVLRLAGLTRTRREGTRRFVSLRLEELEQRFPGLIAVVARLNG